MNEDARHDFESATHRYRVAQAAFDEAPDEVDLVRVQRVVDEATWSMARARAIVDGRRPPDPPATLQRPDITVSRRSGWMTDCHGAGQLRCDRRRRRHCGVDDGTFARR
jgi:hypothetical protein